MAKCKWGTLKNPKGRRRCKKRPARGKGGGGKGRCRWGKLKNPIGKRRCKKRPFRGGGLRTKAAQEAAMWKAYKSGSLGRYRRIRRRR